MTDHKPTVTIVMPVYNGARYLRASLDSILRQTFSDFECLVIDDRSTDASRDVIKSYRDPRIRLVEHDKNLGLVKTLNHGLALARGQYIARQDQDDVSHPTRLEKQVAFLDVHPDVAVLGTQVYSLDPRGRRHYPYGCYTASSALAIRWQILFDNPFVHPSVMMRTQMVRAISGYDERFPECEDYDLFSRLVHAYQGTNLKEPLVDYRYHDRSMDANRTKENNLLIGEIWRRNFKDHLNAEPGAAWMKFWLGINQPQDFDFVAHAEDVINSLNVIYGQFVSRYPQAQKDVQIRQHIAQILIRMSYKAALKDRRASFIFFRQVFKNDALLALKFLPKYFAAFVLGPRRIVLSQGLKKFFQQTKGC